MSVFRSQNGTTWTVGVKGKPEYLKRNMSTDAARAYELELNNMFAAEAMDEAVSLAEDVEVVAVDESAAEEVAEVLEAAAEKPKKTRKKKGE